MERVLGFMYFLPATLVSIFDIEKVLGVQVWGASMGLIPNQGHLVRERKGA